jgi:hypothetical protein
MKDSAHAKNTTESNEHVPFVSVLRSNWPKRDFLSWAIAHTTLELRDLTNGGPRPTRRNVLTHDIPNDLVEDVIEYSDETGLMERYERLRTLEQEYFPERFRLDEDPSPPKPPPTPPPTETQPHGRM